MTIKPHTTNTMLSLNIKSSNYMCIDIHTGNYTSLDDGLLEYYIKKKIKEVSDDSYHKHNLTMLDSFHISLGTPSETEEDLEAYEEYKNHTIDPKKVVPIIGDIVLAPIKISEKEGKKSAWIPLDAEWFFEVFWINGLSEDHFNGYPGNDLNLNDFYPYYQRYGETPQYLHVTVANLTGKRRDSISRPEDCIIDTITS